MTELTGITWDHPRGYAALEALSACYAQKHGIEITWKRRSLKDFGDAPVHRLADRFDLLVMDYPHCGLAEAEGALLPWDAGEIEARLYPDCADWPMVRSFRRGSRLWALPVDAAFQCAACRTGVEPPARLDGIFAADGMIMALCPTDIMCTFLSLAAAMVNDSASGKRTAPARPAPGDQSRSDSEARRFFNPDIFHPVLDLIRRIAACSHPDSATMNPIAVFERMSEDARARYCPFVFNYLHYTVAHKAATTVRLVSPPAVTALLGGAGLAVSSACSRPDAARAFAEWVCGPDVQSGGYFEAGGQPGHPAFYLENSDIVPLDALRNAYVRPTSAGWPAFQEEFGDRLHAVVFTGADADRCRTEMVSRFPEER